MDELSEQARAWLADPAHAISVADARLRDAGLERRFLEAQARRRGKRLERTVGKGTVDRLFIHAIYLGRRVQISIVLRRSVFGVCSLFIQAIYQDMVSSRLSTAPIPLLQFTLASLDRFLRFHQISPFPLPIDPHLVTSLRTLPFVYSFIIQLSLSLALSPLKLVFPPICQLSLEISLAISISQSLDLDLDLDLAHRTLSCFPLVHPNYSFFLILFNFPILLPSPSPQLHSPTPIPLTQL